MCTMFRNTETDNWLHTLSVLNAPKPCPCVNQFVLYMCSERRCLERCYYAGHQTWSKTSDSEHRRQSTGL